MKMLYISQGNHVDFQDDCLFIGLKELLGVNVVDANRRHHIYTSLDPSWTHNYYGRGFTVTRVLEEDAVDRTDIECKIKNKFYDFIVYGSVNRCLNYFEIVNENYSKNKIILVDGEDETWFKNDLNQKGYPYFKREKIFNDGTFPISFAIPTSKIQPISSKTINLAPMIPGDLSTYIYTNEKDYYNNYNKSKFALTTKKSGWDCMRHYEILACNCIPIFINLRKCPDTIMTNFPKQKIIEVLEKSIKNKNILFEEDLYEAVNQSNSMKIKTLLKNNIHLNEFNHSEFLDIQNYLNEYTKNNLSTLALAKYFINTIQDLQ